MVAYSAVLASNAQIAERTPKPFVAVFAGATSGIGEVTLTTLVKYVPQPRIYLFARNEASAERVIAKCRQINPQGQYTFVKADLSSIKETDQACDYVKSKETSVNLAFLSAGEIKLGGLTSEGLNTFMAVMFYSRMRIAQHLSPLLTSAASSGSLARVIDVGGGTYEGKVHVSDLPAINIPMRQVRAHATSLHTLALESLQEAAPNVSFVHNYPGTVATELHKDVPGVMGLVLGTVFPLVYFFLGRWLCVELGECGERQVYLATSDKYVAGQGKARGVALGEEAVANGSDGAPGSGVYSVNWDGEKRGEESLVQLRKLREEGVKEKVWSHLTGEFDRIAGAGK